MTPSQTLPWSLPITLLFIPGCLATEFGDDFANNLFTDLAPLIALFGERVTMQYMSQATGWADSFTLAMAPLGILTIIVSAIRVGGPSWLKALIGRARENLAAAEVELMSSTSQDVCELWNGSDIVRSLGSPPVREFILLLPESRGNTSSSTGSFEFECKTIEEAENDGYLTTSKGSGDSEKGTSAHISGRKEIELKELKRPNKVIIIYNESTSAPNISLNVHPQKRCEVRIAAILGTVLQVGVLVYAGFATYYHTMRFPKEENKPVSNYAFPCTASGTILLVIGLFLCADVVEKRTAEVHRRPRSGFEAYAIWVQREATVGDQVFRSFGIFSDAPREEVITSRRDNDSKKDAGASFVDRAVQLVCYVPLQILEFFIKVLDKKTSSSTHNSKRSSKSTLGALLSISGYVIQFVGLRDMHWSVSIVQLGAVVSMTAARAAIRRGLATSPSAQSLFQNFELEWLASTITSINGSRWKVPATDSLPWTKWVVLGNEGVHLDSEVHGRSSNGQHQDGSQEGDVDDAEEANDEDSEDDSQDKSGRNDKKEGREDDNGKDSEEGCGETSSNIGTHSDGLGDASTNNRGDVDLSHDIEAAYEDQKGRVNESNDEHLTNKFSSKAQTVMILRSHFAKSTGWQSPVFTEANSLSRAIEVVMNTLFLNSGLTQFNWPLRAMYNDQEPQVINVPMSLVNGNWKVSRHDVEAILSLWILSTKNDPRDGHASREIDTTINGPGVHLLGADTPQLRRDIKWWIPQDLRKVMIVRESPNDSLVVDKSLVVGCGRATKPKVKLERTDLSEDDNNPPYGKAVERGLVAVESFQSPVSLFSLSLFSSFLSAAAKEMNEPIKGQAEVNPNDSSNLSSWTSFTLHHASLSKMASEVQSTRLATLSEAYSVIIPSLSIENKLPQVDNVIELAREHAKSYEERNDMRRATDVYLWLIRTANLFPSDTPFVHKSMAVILEHLGQLIKSIKLSSRLIPVALPSMRLIDNMVLEKVNASLKQIESELQLDKVESRNTFVRLMRIYYEQDRLGIFPSRLIEIAKQDPTFPQQRPQIYSTVHKYDEEFVEMEAVTGWTKLHWDAAENDDISLFDRLQKDIDPNTRDLLGHTALHLACQASSFPTASLLVTNGADINVRARSASTPLHYAARDGNMLITELLITSGAEFNATDATGMTPAMWAALEGRKDVLKYLLKNSSLNLRDSGGRATLHHAVLSRSTGIVDVFEQGVDSEVRDHGGRTPLHLAAFSGNDVALSMLTKRLKVSTGAVDESGNNWLHFAAAGGQIAIMNRLISEFDTDINCENGDRETPLHLFVRRSKATAIEAVMKMKPNLEARNKIGETPLMVACKLGRISIVKQLVKCGANRNTTDNNRSSLLIAAVLRGYKKVSRYILSIEVDKDHQLFGGSSALHVAAEYGKCRIVQMLIDEKADKDKLDDDGRTPLHKAAQEAHSAVVEILLNAGANIEAKDHQGWTPLHHAALGTWGRKDLDGERTVRLLLDRGADKQAINKDGKTARQLAEETGGQRVVGMLDTA
ncbi:ankyrin repeat [Fusarium sp. NRRL 52700]|nr:ankyrin repeat [Fusarium sp. NRRL 52700]